MGEPRTSAPEINFCLRPCGYTSKRALAWKQLKDACSTLQLTAEWPYSDAF